MIKALMGQFGKRPTTKIDVYLAAGAAAMAFIHFVDVKKQYKTEQNIENDIEEINS